MNLLEVKNLSVNFINDNQTIYAVKNISFSLQKGKTLAIVGESGSGKSVTALSILKLLPYPKANHPSGKILFKDNDLLKYSEKQMQIIRGNQIGMIFQEPMTSLNPLHNIEKQISESLFIHKGIVGKKAREKVLDLLNRVGIKEPEKRLKSFPHQLSGGQRQRVMIAMAIANEPELLIADEPTTALDVTIQAQVLKLLKDLQKSMNMSMLFISHDLEVVKNFSDDILVMKNGKIVEFGSTSEVFNNPKEAYTKNLINVGKHIKPVKTFKDAKSIMEIEDLKVYFPIKKGILQKTIDYIKAVDGLNLNIKEGTSLGIVGESGSGKTTLGLAILKLIKSKGKIIYQGKRIDSINNKEMKLLRKNLQMVFQDPYGSLSPRMSILQIIEEGLKIHSNKTKKEREEEVIKVLKEVGLNPDSRHRYPHEFSGGQRQRISIARALILKPSLIILDEPTSALDRTVQFQIIELLKSLQEKYKITYIFISHDLKVVKALCHEIIVMKSGKIAEFGTSEKIFSSPESEYTKALINAAFDL
jgi:microcin C transport system ATP-binding protein